MSQTSPDQPKRHSAESTRIDSRNVIKQHEKSLPETWSLVVSFLKREHSFKVHKKKVIRLQ